MKPSCRQTGNPYLPLKAELLDGTRVRFTCPEGHRTVKDMAAPHGKRHPARLDRSGVSLLVRHWTPAPGVAGSGLRGPCPWCQKKSGQTR